MTAVELRPQRVSSAHTAVSGPFRLWALWVSAVVVTSCAGVWITTGRLSQSGLLDGWHNMDVEWYVNIAKYGYESPEPGGHYEFGKPAYFPLLPALIRVVHVVTGSWMIAGLLVSLTASLVAVYLLWRLVRDLTADESTARLVPALLLCSPFAVYLFVPYTESLFLALVLGVFLAMRAGRWGLAGLLGAFAAVTRPTGSLLISAIAVEWIVQRRRAALLSGQPLSGFSGLKAVTPPLTALAAWQTYLWSATGNWDAFSRAEAVVWHRHIVNPVTALWSTLETAVVFRGSWYEYYWISEILSVILGFILAYMLARRGLWSWATFIGLNAFVLSLSSTYGSSSRAVLTWFPAFILLAIWLQSRPRWRIAYFAISGPLMLVFVTSFTAGNWVA
jgi:hypothetical protein